MDHLSDEDLREWRDRRDPSGQAIHSGPVYPLIDELLVLRARVGQLEAALRLAQMHPYGAALKDATDEDVIAALCARVAQLEAALISMTKGANWKSADKDNMEFEGRVTCYQLDQARAALKDATR